MILWSVWSGEDQDGVSWKKFERSWPVCNAHKVHRTGAFTWSWARRTWNGKRGLIFWSGITGRVFISAVGRCSPIDYRSTGHHTHLHVFRKFGKFANFVAPLFCQLRSFGGSSEISCKISQEISLVCEISPPISINCLLVISHEISSREISISSAKVRKTVSFHCER